MKNIGIYDEITKDYILDNISQEDIMFRFLNIPVNNNTLRANSVLSPFRQDKNPTCNYWYNENGKLRFRDWGGSFNGDCFDVAGKVLGYDANNKQGFKIILEEIAKAFNIGKYRKSNILIKTKKNYTNIIDNYEKEILQFIITPRKWNQTDKKYWYGKYGLEFKDLIGVYPINTLHIKYKDKSPKFIYSYISSDVAYAYYGGKTNKGIGIWKIYFPFRRRGDKEKPKFLENTSFLQGEKIITGGQFGGITKSYKDVLCFRKLGIQTVAPHAEGTIITKDEYFRLNYLFDTLFSTMDFDKTGIHSAWLHKTIYNIKPIMFTNGLFDTIDYGSKDLSDYIEANGLDKAKILVSEIYEKYKDTINEISKERNKNILWINQKYY